jgi:hypothetical protein
MAQAGSACALAGVLPGDAGAATNGSATTLPALASRPSSGLIPTTLKSVVADIRAREIVADTVIHETLLREVIDEGVRIAVPGAASASEAWNRILRPDDVVGIKFNRIGQDSINTTAPFAAQLVESLKKADVSPRRIMLIEAPDRLTRELKTRACPTGYSGPKVSFSSGEDELASLLQEATAIVNVPFLKTHNVAEMTGCLKNLSHALIRRPRLCHRNGCAPFVGDILALPQIRPLLRLHIVNALRAVFDGGPLPSPETTWTHSGVLVGTDPVAVDAVGTDILNEVRLKRKLPAIGDRDGRIAHVHAAAARGLGTDDQDYITVVRPKMF